MTRLIFLISGLLIIGCSNSTDSSHQQMNEIKAPQETIELTRLIDQEGRFAMRRYVDHKTGVTCYEVKGIYCLKLDSKPSQ